MIFLLSLVLPGLYAFILKYANIGSDHPVHILIINIIQRNKHKYFVRFDNLVNGHVVSYPTLLHWLVAFFPLHWILSYAKYLNVFFSFIQVLVFTAFLYSVPYRWTASELVIAILLFTLQPYNFNQSNAKNAGLSARGFGLLLGQMYIYCLVLFLLTHTEVYLFGSVISAVLVVLSSQFATQALIFTWLPISVISMDWRIWLTLPVSGLVFIVFFPKLARSYFRGQVEHKVLYKRYLAPISLFQSHYNFWHDLAVIIPRLIGFKILGRKDRLKGSLRVHLEKNALSLSVIQFPVMFCSVLGMLFFPNDGEFDLRLPLFGLSAMVIFLLVSTNNFRHFGEAERYLEFFTGIFCLVAIRYVPILLLLLLILYCLAYSLLLMYDVYRNRDKGGQKQQMPWSDLKQFLQSSNARFVSVDTQIAKFLLDVDIKTFYYLVNTLKNDHFKFEEVHGSKFQYLNPFLVPEIISYYKLNYVLIPKDMEREYLVQLSKPKFSLNRVQSFENQSLFAIELNLGG